jgi:hypothetical protein
VRAFDGGARQEILSRRFFLVRAPEGPHPRSRAPRCLVAALITRLAFVAQQARRLSSASALVTGLTLIAELARRLIGERGARRGQSEQAGE